MTHKATWATACLVLLSAAAAHAASIVFSPTSTPPTLGPNDISNFTGAAADANNVAGGNDSATYVAQDKPAQGQTFTTGVNAGGYTLTAVTLQQVSYSTFVQTNTPSTTLTIRLNSVSAGTTLTTLRTETATATSADPNRFGDFDNNAPAGSGRFITFTFATPVSLASNTLYGFDVDVTGGGQYFFETNGTATNPYSGGQAYSSGDATQNAGGTTGLNSLSPQTGDRVFIASVQAVPEPSAVALSLISGIGFLWLRRRRN